MHSLVINFVSIGRRWDLWQVLTTFTKLQIQKQAKSASVIEILIMRKCYNKLGISKNFFEGLKLTLSLSTKIWICSLIQLYSCLNNIRCNLLVSSLFISYNFLYVSRSKISFFFLADDLITELIDTFIHRHRRNK